MPSISIAKGSKKSNSDGLSIPFPNMSWIVVAKVSFSLRSLGTDRDGSFKISKNSEDRILSS